MLKHVRYLSDYPDFNHGYIIVNDTLFQIDHGDVYESWQLSAKKLKDMVAEARELADLSKTKKVYYCDIEGYNEYTISNEGRFLSDDEAYDDMDPEERQGWEDIIENLNK